VPAKRVPLELHLAAMSPEERAIWDRFVELVEATGPSEMIVTKSRVAFRSAHRIFTGGFFKTRRLELFFDLPEPVPESERDERFRQVWQHSRRLWTHRLKISSVEELDESSARGSPSHGRRIRSLRPSAERLRRGRWPWAEAMEFAEELGDGGRCLRGRSALLVGA
jgi:hypothetical protein